jgi:hypothetical protein
MIVKLFSSLVIPGRAEGAGLESILTAGGYGFRLSPLTRLGRNDA